MLIVRSLAIAATALAVCWDGAAAQTGLVKLDYVTLSVPGDNQRLMSNQIHRAYIRYDLRGCTPGYWSTDNSFEVYSPDGADWGYLKGAFGQLVEALPETVDLIYGSHWYSTYLGQDWTVTGNTGADSAPGSGGIFTRAGYRLVVVDFSPPGGFTGGTDNGIALTLEFIARDLDDGRTICVDTVRSFGSGGWSWNRSTLTDYPRWDNGLGVSGPRCWEIYHLPCSPEEPTRERTRATASETACDYCCTMRVGNADGSEEEMPSLGDVMTIVDAKFITGNCNVISCLDEADINKSASSFATCDDVTLGDIMTLVDYLFITGPENATLPVCY